jgi:hypothetical protein
LLYASLIRLRTTHAHFHLGRLATVWLSEIANELDLGGQA